MKLSVYIAVLLCCVLFLIGGCSSGAETVVPEPQPGEETTELRFAVSSVQTRENTVQHVDSILSMGIFGYSTGNEEFSATNVLHTPNLLYNQQAKRPRGGEWSYSPVAYWPIDLSVKNTFFAYAPHSSEFSEEANVRISEADESGYPTLRYTIPSNVADQKDILYATPVLNKNRKSNDGIVTDGRVNYEMKHALTWLAFVVAPTMYSNPDEKYTINWFAFMADNIPVASTLNLGTGTWSNTFYESALYEFELTEAAKDIKPGDVARIVDPSNRLMLFPFEIGGDASGTSIDLTFTYDPGLERAGVENPEDPEEYYYFIPFPTTRMTAGNVVVYLINISADGISVSFLEENKIEDWLKGESKEVEIF